MPHSKTNRLSGGRGMVGEAPLPSCAASIEIRTFQIFGPTFTSVGFSGIIFPFPVLLSFSVELGGGRTGGLALRCVPF